MRSNRLVLESSPHPDRPLQIIVMIGQRLADTPLRSHPISTGTIISSHPSGVVHAKTLLGSRTALQGTAVPGELPGYSRNAPVTLFNTRRKPMTASTITTESDLGNRYILQFNYTDNGQLYEDFLLLSDAEARLINLALATLFDAGDIRSADGDRTSVGLLKLYIAPEFRRFDEMRRSWNDGTLNERLKDQDFNWESAS